MIISYIKISEGQVHIKWRAEATGAEATGAEAMDARREEQSNDFKCSGTPASPFLLAYDEQKRVIVEMLQFEIGPGDLVLNSVTYDRGKERVTYSVGIYCNGLTAPANMTLPTIGRYVPEESTAERQRVLADIKDANAGLDTLLDLARAYVDGERDDGELFDYAREREQQNGEGEGEEER